MRSLLALLLLVGLAPAAPVPKELTKPKTPSHVGVWKPVGGSEWFEFDAEGGMKAWTTNGANNPVLYTYTLDPEPDGPPWRMIWSMKGQQQPSHQAVFVVDGDGMKLSYTSAGGQPLPKPGPDFASSYTFTRQPAK